MTKTIALLLLFLSLYCSDILGQPAPEYHILFEVVKDGIALDDSNTKFILYRSCNNKKQKLKQGDHLKTIRVSTKNQKTKRRISVLHQYLECEKIIVKIKHEEEEMEIHFWTDQSFIKDIYGKFYLHDPIEFTPNKIKTFHLGDYLDDSLMGTEAIGFSGVYHWVLTPTLFDQSSLFLRPAKFSVDSIILFKNSTMSRVNFEMDIGIDSLNRRYPSFCYSQDAQRINYSFAFEAYKLNSEEEWIEASADTDLIFRYTTLCPTCDLSKSVDDANAYEYFRHLKHRFSINFYKPGTYKIVSKTDSTLNTTFTINPSTSSKKLDSGHATLLPNQNQLIGNWELAIATGDALKNKKINKHNFLIQDLRFLKNNKCLVLKLEGTPNSNEVVLQQKEGFYFLRQQSIGINFPLLLGAPMRRGLPDLSFQIISLTDSILTVSNSGDFGNGIFTATFVKY